MPAATVRFVQIPRAQMAGAIMTGLREAVRRLRGRWRERRELLEMDEIGLRDLSLTGADASREAERPFWTPLRIPKRDAPSRLNHRQAYRSAVSD